MTLKNKEKEHKFMKQICFPQDKQIFFFMLGQYTIVLEEIKRV